LRQRRIERKLRGLANTTFSTTEKEVKREAAKKNLQQTLISVGNLYNKKNKNQHVCGISMYKRSFNIDSFKNDSSIKKSLVFQVVIPK
jgi:spore coat protein CotF